MSEWLVLSLAMAAACAVVLSIAFFNHRRIGEDDDPNETPDVIEYMTMMIGVIYAIVLGLAIAGVWEGRGAAQEYVRQEAQALHEISTRSEVYPAEVRKKIRSDVDAYVTYVVDTEWQEMADSGELTDRGGELLERIRRDVTDYEPQTDHEGQAYQPLVDQVAVADDARSARGQSAGATMPGVVWFGLITGALVTVGLIFTLQIRRSFRELLLAGLFSALIAFLLFLIWDFDAPFGRGIAATAEPFLAQFPHLGLTE
ncbi:bestrophin-like domain [Streptomyces sp. NPDC002587]